MKLNILFFSLLILLASCGGQQLDNTASTSVAPIQASNKYRCSKTSHKIDIDGNLLEKDWLRVPWMNKLLPMTVDKKDREAYDTVVKTLWDENYFYVAAKLNDLHILATLQQRDTQLYKDDVFEIFIDPDGDGNDYYEIEINALATVWDLKLSKSPIVGGKANSKWNIKGLRKAVSVEGDVKKSNQEDASWTIELAIPWAAFKERRPKHMEEWRMNFTRIDWDKRREVPALWTWSPLGKPHNFHQPQKWGYVQFIN